MREGAVRASVQADLAENFTLDTKNGKLLRNILNCGFHLVNSVTVEIPT